jgi:hypothetical protein
VSSRESAQWIGALPTGPDPALEPEAPLPSWLTATGVGVFCLVSILSALVEVLLVPLYIGSIIFPLTLLLAAVGNIALPRLVSVLHDSGIAIALPSILWVTTVFGIGTVNTSGGDVLVPGGGNDQYVSLGLLFGGTLACVIGTVRANGKRPRALRPPIAAPPQPTPKGPRAGSGRAGSGRR